MVEKTIEGKNLLEEKSRLEAENRLYQAVLEEKVTKRTVELEQRNRELAALIEIGRDISATLDLSEVLKRVAQRAAQVCDANRCTILLISQDGKRLTPRMSQFSNGHIAPELWSLFQDASYPIVIREVPEVQQVFRERRPRFISDVSASSLPDHLTKPFNIESVLLLPMLSKERSIGLMALDWLETSKVCSRQKIDLAEAIAAQAAVAIENAQLHEEMQQRAIQLEAASQVARNATAILDVDQLLDETVHLISDQFGFYHAGIFLMDEKEEYAVLQAASSEGGRQMLERGHKLAVGKVGIVGYATGTGKPRIALDVGKDAVYFDNPDMPETRSEMALPLVSRGRVIGALDVQSTREAAFTEEDIATLQTMADQLANAIENARLFSETRRRVAELEAVQKTGLRLVSSLELQPLMEAILESVLELMSADDAHIFYYEDGNLSFGAALWAEDVRSKPYSEPREDGLTYAVARRGERIVVPDVNSHPLFEKWQWGGAIVGLPLRVGEQVRGVMNVAFKEPHIFNDDELRILGLLADQAAIAIENARLFEAEREQRKLAESLEQAATIVSSTLEIDLVLDRILEQVRRVITCDASNIMLIIRRPEGDQARIVRWHGYERFGADEFVSQATFNIPETDNIQQILEEKEPLLIPDTAQHPGWIKIPEQEWIRSYAAAPIIVRGEVIGLLNVDSATPDFFTPAQLEILHIFADHAAIAIENARLFETEQRRAVQVGTLNRIGRQVASILDRQELLQWAVEAVWEELDYHQVAILLVDEETDELYVAAATENFREIIPDNYRQPVGKGAIGRAAQIGETVLINDAASDQLAYRVEKWLSPSSLSTPIKISGQVVGVLEAEADRPHYFDDIDLLCMETMADQIAIAIENARLYEEAQRHVDELTALHNIDVAINSTLKLDEVLHIIYNQVEKTMHPTAFFIGLYDRDMKKIDFPISIEKGKPLPLPSQELSDRDIGQSKGLSSWVVQNREPLWLNDVDGEPESLPTEAIARGINPGSLMIWPLVVRGQVIGVISTQSHKTRAFDEGHRRLFANIANQAAIAVENARLYEAERHRADQMASLFESGRKLTQSLELEKTLKLIAEQAAQLIDVDHSALFLYDEHEEEIYHVASHVPQAGEVLANMRVPLSYSQTASQAISTRQPLVVADAASDPRMPREIVETFNVKSSLIVPLTLAKRVVGLLFLEESRDIRHFTSEEIGIAANFANRAAMAIENARLFEETNLRLAETRLLQRVMQAAASTLDFDEVLNRTLETIHQIQGIEYLSFALPAETGSAIKFHPFMIGFNAPDEEPIRAPMEECVSGHVYQQGEPMLIPDIREVPYYLGIAPEVQSELAVPVLVSNQIIGVLNAESTQLNAFDEEDLHLFQAIAAQLGVVLENARLYQQLQEQKEELLQAYEELKELDRLRTELVQNVSHELRTPFSLVKGYTDLLLSGDLGALSQGQQKAMKVVHERIGTLEVLIGNLTTLDTVSAQDLELTPVSLTQIARHTLFIFNNTARQAGLTLEDELPEELPIISGDQEQLALVFRHLLDNAIKFSNPGQTVTVRGWSDEDKVYVSVSDQGIGIAEEHLTNIFKRFYQVNGGPSRRFGGMGIGLALVWEIVEAHSGTVSVASKPGQGSTFTVELPR